MKWINKKDFQEVSKKNIRIQIEETCPSCHGDGLYKRHTSYTVNGKPICFRCEGKGTIVTSIPSYVRLYKVRLLSGEVKLVKTADRKNYLQHKQDNNDIVIPF